MFSFSTLGVILVAAASAASAHNTRSFRRHDHDHVARNALPGSWRQEADSPVHALFKRQAPTGTSPQPGTPAWVAQYPSNTPDPAMLPKAWTDALATAISAGKIPGIQPATNVPNASPAYPGQDPTSAGICSSTYQCRSPDSLWDAPDNTVAISFDDGPTPDSGKLYDFLKQNSQKATHFMIGQNVLYNYAMFQRAFGELQDDIAVHTYTHPYMTTLTNEQVLGELGWTIQIIHDATGGSVPRYWRPPFGDSDVRVQAIAREVFGLVTVVWNNDSEDWRISTGQTSQPVVTAAVKKWYTSSKRSPGIMGLEHELSPITVQVFLDSYPLIKQNGWQATSLAQLYTATHGGPYQKAGDPRPLGILAGGSVNTASPSTTAASQQANATTVVVPPGTTAKPTGSLTVTGTGTASVAAAKASQSVTPSNGASTLSSFSLLLPLLLALGLLTVA